MKRVAILSLDPRNGGGILHSLQALYKFCLAENLSPTVFFVNFDPQVSASVRNLTLKSQVSHLELFGMRCVGIGSRWAFWEPGHYQFTLRDWQRELEGFDYFWVSSGTAIAGYPLVLLQKKFLAWIATPLSGDQIGKKNYNPLRWLSAQLARPKMLAIEKSVLQHASYLLPMSMYAKLEFEAICQTKLSKIQVCGYPVEPKTIQVQHNASNFNCISIGRFTDPRKDIGTLLQAWKFVTQKNHTATLHLVGQSPEKYWIKKYAHLFELGQIVMHENVSEATKFELLKNSAVGIISSLQEGLCIAGLEAAQCGLPLVSTNCGGPQDYVIEAITGFVVEKQNPEAMATKILKLLGDAPLREKMGHQAQALVTHFFNQDRIFNIFRAAMQSIWPESYGCKQKL